MEREKTIAAIDKAQSKIERLDDETRIKERIRSPLVLLLERRGRVRQQR